MAADERINGLSVAQKNQVPPVLRKAICMNGNKCKIHAFDDNMFSRSSMFRLIGPRADLFGVHNELSDNGYELRVKNIETLDGEVDATVVLTEA